MAFPISTVLSDDLARPNEDPLSDGGKWAGFTDIHGFQLRLVSHHIEPQTFGDSVTPNFGIGSLWIADGEIGDVDVFVGIEDLAPASLALLARAQTPHGAFTARNCYEAWFSDPGVTIYKTVAGTRTSLISHSQHIVAGDAVGFSVRGDVLQAWWNSGYLSGGTTWVKLCETTDSTYTSGGYPGIAEAGLQSSIASWAAPRAKLVNVWAANFHGRDLG